MSNAPAIIEDMEMPQLERHSDVNWDLIFLVIESVGLPCVAETVEFVTSLAMKATLTPHQLMATAIFAHPLISKPEILHSDHMRGDWRLAFGLGTSFALKLLEETHFYVSDLQTVCPYLNQSYSTAELVEAERMAFGMVDFSCLQSRLQAFRDQTFNL